MLGQIPQTSKRAQRYGLCLGGWVARTVPFGPRFVTNVVAIAARRFRVRRSYLPGRKPNVRKALPVETGECLLLILMIFGLAPAARSAQGPNPETLDNGLVRVTFDRTTGQFEAQSLAGAAMRLLKAGPAIGVEGHTLAPADATKIEVRRDAFADQLGRGTRLVVDYSFRGKLSRFRYELALYDHRPWLSITGYLPSGSYRLGDVSVIKGTLQVRSAFDARLYVSQGSSGGDSGVWPLGMRAWESAAVSVYYTPETRDAMGIGFCSFSRASTSVISRYLAPDTIGVNAAAHYYGYRPEGQALTTERALISFGRDPLRLLENWADAVVKVVQPQFDHDARTGWLNVWFMYGDRTTAEDVLKQARLLRDSVLSRYYGITVADTGEWQLQNAAPGDTADNYGFGDNRVDPRLFPHGLERCFRHIEGMGLETNFGANYAYAAFDSPPVTNNLPWVVREDRGNMNFGYPIDFTDPRAQKWLYDVARRAVKLKASWWWTDFDGGPTRGPLHDPTKIMGFEDVREGLEVTKKALGPGIHIEKFCCGPYFTYLGMTDRVRTGNDMAALGDFADFKAIARQLAATYVFHQRFWINDPDDVFVGGRNFVHDYGTGLIGPDPSIRNAVRMRLQFQTLTGGPPTIGENLEDLDRERIHLLTLVLPSYGQAARPLDLFIHNTPEIYDLRVRTKWDAWHVLLLQNWGAVEKSYAISFSHLGLKDNEPYLVFRFWDQHFLGKFTTQVRLTVGARQGGTYAIREPRPYPWVLSTDMHLTQGGVELDGVNWDAGSKRLAGVAIRHPGDVGHVVIYVPSGYTISSASGPYQIERQASGAAVVPLEVKFGAQKAPWQITFAGTRAPSVPSATR